METRNEQMEIPTASVEAKGDTQTNAERRAQIGAWLGARLSALIELERGIGSPLDIVMRSKPEELSQHAEADRLRRDCNALITAMNAVRPNGTSPIRTFYENAAAMKALVALADRKLANRTKRRMGISVPDAELIDSNETDAVVVAYSKDRPVYQEADPRETFRKLPETLRNWQELERLWDNLGIGPAAESVEAGELPERETLRRSFANMRDRVQSFVDEIRRTLEGERRDRGEPEDVPYSDVAAEAARRIRSRLDGEAGKTIDLVYYEQPEDVPLLFSSNSIKQISELPPSDQSDRRKSEWKNLDQIMRERREVESALGWRDGGPVYHFVAQTETDMSRAGGPADNYGAIGFVIDQAKIGIEPTFTEGDSLNPAPLPVFYPTERGGDAVLRRAVAREHLPLANAMLEEGRQLHPTPIYNKLRYIEAQVGGVSGADLFAAVKEVVINLRVLNLENQYQTEAKIATHRVERERIEALCAERGIPIRYVP